MNNNTKKNTTTKAKTKATTKAKTKKTNPVQKSSFNKGQIVALCVIGLSCLAVVCGFVYSYYQDGSTSLFGSNNSTGGSGLTGSDFEVADEDITTYVAPNTLLDWTQEAEDTLEEYVADEDESIADEEEVESDSTVDTSSNSNSSSNNSSSNNSNSSSNSSNSSTESTTPSETLGKGEWLAKYYDGGVIRYYGDGSVYDMTRNVWWTKTQWNDFMVSITQ